jgi:tetratricopeptide (TPR) repeat protein
LSEAEQLFQQALVIRQQALPEGHPDIATSLNDLALLYKVQNRLSEAEPLFQQALAIWQQALPEGHPHIATSLNNLAMLYKAQNRFSEAEPLLQQGLAIVQQALPEGHPGIATSLINLAGVYLLQGKVDLTERVFTALLKQELSLGVSEVQINKVLNIIFVIYKSAGYEDAEQKAVAIFQAFIADLSH